MSDTFCGERMLTDETDIERLAADLKLMLTDCKSSHYVMSAIVMVQRYTDWESEQLMIDGADLSEE